MSWYHFPIIVASHSLVTPAQLWFVVICLNTRHRNILLQLPANHFVKCLSCCICHWFLAMVDAVAVAKRTSDTNIWLGQYQNSANSMINLTKTTLKASARLYPDLSQKVGSMKMIKIQFHEFQSEFFYSGDCNLDWNVSLTSPQNINWTWWAAAADVDYQ